MGPPLPPSIPARGRSGGIRAVVTPLALAALGLIAGAGLALASDEAGLKDLEARYKKLARNKDENANRERRKLLLQSFDFLDQKGSRKFLRDAYGEEPTPDGRLTVVQVLAASGDPKDLDFLVGAFKKEKSPAPAIVLGQGLSFTAPAQAAAISTYAVALAAKQKGEPVRALLEGVAELGDPAAYAPLQTIGAKIDKAAEFERLIALGACGRAESRPHLDRALTSTDADLRLAAVLGMSRTGGPDQPPADPLLQSLLAALADSDPRVVEAAANALAKTKHAAAVTPLAEALRGTPLRTREALRAALRAITGRDAGHDADAWLAKDGKAPPPTLPAFAGLAVASDQVAVILDLSRSMAWQGRLEQAQKTLTEFIGTLPDDAVFGVLAAARNPAPLSDKLASGPAARTHAEEWIRKQLTASGSDLRQALLYVVRQWPSIDTIVVATDSAPWGASADETPLAVIHEFRRENRHHRMRVFVAFTAPGGRYEPSETEPDEFAERKDLLKQLAEQTGGAFKALE